MVDPNPVNPGLVLNTGLLAGGRKNISVLIMDSGLGGLSICADLVNGLGRHSRFRRVAITYFNAWPEQNRGYNSLPDTSERLRVFDRALTGIQPFGPDIVCLACNTLSILYPQTEFSRTTQTPVIGIIDFGVDLIHGHLLRQPDSQVIILGTLATIASKAHHNALVTRGIDHRRVVGQACDQLATEIENDPDGLKVRTMIDACIRQAAVRLVNPQAPVIAALCCTHYGYAQAGFKHSLDSHIGPNAIILNPNEAMSAHLIHSFSGQHISSAAKIDLKVVSRIKWSDRKVAAIAGALQSVSPITAQALMNYRHDPGLFSF